LQLLPGLLNLKTKKEALGEPTGPVNFFINSHRSSGELLRELEERKGSKRPTDQIEVELRLRGIQL